MIRRPPTQISLQSSDVEDLKMQRQKIREDENQAQIASRWVDQSEQQHYQQQSHENSRNDSINETGNAIQGQR